MPETESDLANVKFEEIETEEDSGQIDEYSIVASPNDFNTRTMTSFIEEGAVKIPRFQRNYVWDRRRASKLIESLILGLPIPQVFLYEQGNNEFLIIDGQQRLLTVFFFMKGRFPRKEKRSALRDRFTSKEGFTEELLSNDEYFEPFKLSLPKPPSRRNKKAEPNRFNGLTYSALGDNKLSFDLRTIRNIIVKQVTPKDGHSSMFEMFNRLNTGGVNLNQQEIRASLFHSDFFEELFSLNKYDKWRDLLGTETPDSRMKDIEMILRCLTLREGTSGYAGSMNSFVNKFCERAKEFSNAEIEKTRSEWQWFLQKNQACDEKTYRTGPAKASRFSPLLFEAVYVAAMNLKDRGKTVPEITPHVVSQIAGHSEFIDSTHEGSTKTTNTDNRLETAKKVLESVGR